MNLIRRKRLDLDMKQVELAKRSGIVYSTVSMIERGHIQPSAKQKRRLAKSLKCAIEEIFPSDKSRRDDEKTNS
jgi:DNA-binding XRE family transcriptional regulator